MDRSQRQSRISLGHPRISILHSSVGLFVASLFCLLPSLAEAHQYRGMSSQVTIEPTSISITLRIAHQDLVLLAPPIDRNRDEALSPEEYEAAKEKLVQVAGESFLVAESGQQVPLTTGSVAVAGTGLFNGNIDELQFELAYQPKAPATSFTTVLLNPNLFREIGEVSPITGKPIINAPNHTLSILDQGNRRILHATGTETYETRIGQPGAGDGGSTGTAMADGSGTGSTDTSKGATSTGRLMATFFWEGILHILLGWDHIFFVIGLVLIAAKFSDLFKVITAFTIAHSITLIASSLGIIPGQGPQFLKVVEALIAATVAFVGIENLFRLEAPPKWRWVVVFFFGLIHGFGFASVLSDLLTDHQGGGRGLMVACLLVFNLGVEFGQIMVVAIIYPLLQWLRRRSPVAHKRVVIAGSIFICFMGVSWVLDRTFLPDTFPWLKIFEE